MSAPTPTAAPEKSSADIQAEAEAKRIKRGLSSDGLAGLVFTSALGDTSSPSARGVKLG